MYRALPLVLLTVSVLGACVDPDPPVLRTLVTVVATQDGQPAEQATTQLVLQGQKSLVVIEAALHMADVPGRRRLVRAIQRIGDTGDANRKEGCPLLGHLATYDDDSTVRDVAKAALIPCGPG